MFAVCGNAVAQTVLVPHFTEQSIKIPVPKDDAQVYSEIHEGLIKIYSNGRSLFVDKAGKYVYGTDFPIFDRNSYVPNFFSGGALIAYRKPKTGEWSNVPIIVYPDGKYREFPEYKNSYGGKAEVFYTTSFCDGYAIITVGNMMSPSQFYIDKNGKEVFPQLKSKKTDGDIYPVCENRRIFFNSELAKYGYADEKGNIVIKPQFDKAQNFSEGLAAVCFKENYIEKWGFIDLTGKLVIPATYKLKPGRFSEGLAAVRIGESESDYEMAYIDKTGKRVIENKPWNLNEFHNGYAWVGTGCEKLFVWNTKFEEVRDVTKDFYHDGNGFGVCNFEMYSGKVTDKDWGIDFPNGTQALNQGGLQEGDIFAPDGAIIYTARDAKGSEVLLNAMTEEGLMLCRVRFYDEARLKEKDVYLSCFINQKGEVVYYFEPAVEGFEGPAPVEIKATPVAKTATPTKKPAPKK
ncbi:MAG: WG repeat-containing protein [Dysgonamonadaceae bacterium]|nr:WG repeat-containing protein [Dysgonamonadaceae bacterium]